MNIFKRAKPDILAKYNKDPEPTKNNILVSLSESVLDKFREQNLRAREEVFADLRRRGML